MTEDDARAWLVDHCAVSRETSERIEAFARAVLIENGHQNLISAATEPHIWARHIVDSAQLWMLRPKRPSIPAWLDLGTGAGFPGMVIAILGDLPVILVEARRKRFEFLSRQVECLRLGNVAIHRGRLEMLQTQPVGVISARAFAPLPRLFALAHRFSTNETVWLLPKGRSVREELESARASWQGVFHVEPSLTDAEAAILVATGVRPRKSVR